MHRVGFCLLLCISVQLSLAASRHPFVNRQVKSVPINELEDNGSPLILTEYIVKGRIEEGVKAAEVNHPAFLNVTHYTGFFTVNETFNSNLFTWFFPSESDPLNDPVVVWLQGGPGSSSLFGLFGENGPFEMKNEKEVNLRKERWSKTHNLIYIDNPAGTGYSFTNPGGYAHDEEQVGRELYEALQQFFLLFPKLRSNDFFITGESYAGHYIPAISYTILKNNRLASEKYQINLKGIAIGDGWTDPINQLNYGEYLYQHGFVDLKMKNELNAHRDKAIDYINKEQFAAARIEFNLILSIFEDGTGYTNPYNYLDINDGGSSSLMDVFVQSSDIRKAIHVGNLIYHDGNEVNNALNSDVMKSVVHLLPELINNYRVLIYGGQVDIIVAYPLSVSWLEKLQFSNAEEYKTARRGTWYVNNEIAGFVKVAGNLTDLLVRNAGHMVPTDQPTWASDLINRFTRNKSFDDSLWMKHK
ncbi:hypothetical protein WA026_008428 [Henosepilachna vigintioctopunctata]|uniref:Carboxypeptidase n=1 Tax=Henosepilachna vigintioctopunctata TaxID=420089 RepID=A0AAW1UGV2_9CUCU